MRASKLFLIIFSMAVNLACDETLNRPLAPPNPLIITSFSPRSKAEVPHSSIEAKPVIVTIIGTGFSDQKSGNIATFAPTGQGRRGFQGTILTATTTQLTVQVPWLVSYGDFDLYVTAFGFTVKAKEKYTNN